MPACRAARVMRDNTQGGIGHWGGIRRGAAGRGHGGVRPRPRMTAVNSRRERVTWRKEGETVQGLAVLAPSLIVCAAFLAGVFALLRHEMAPRRRGREDGGSGGDMPAGPPFSGEQEFPGAGEPGAAAASSHPETTGQRRVRRSSRGV